MLRMGSTRGGGSRRIGVACAAGTLGLFVAAPANAHFSLDAPVSWMSQDTAGSPQKLGPCGNEGGTATGVITPFQAGQTITLKWTEVVPHDGWYRIALSYANRVDFVDPPVVIASNGFSADAGIESPAAAPVLADGLFPHKASNTPTGFKYSYNLTLPKTPCTKCTLQVIQFMNAHPSNLANLPDGAINPDGYFYHHCADISIAAADSGAAVSGASGAGDASVSAESDATVSGGSGQSTGASGGGMPSSGSAATTGSATGTSAPSGSSSGTSGSGGTATGTGAGTASGTSSGTATDASAASSGTGGSAAESNAPSGSNNSGGCIIAPGRASPTVTGIGALLALAAGMRRRRRR